MGLFNALFGGGRSSEPAKTKIAWDFHLTKYSVLQYVESNYQYFEREFNQNDDWPNIYRLDSYYKNTVLSPFRQLLNTNESTLSFIEYEDDSFYIGQTDAGGNKHGIGLYHWAREKDSEGDIHRDMFVGYWEHGQRTNNGSYVHFSDDTKTWFEASGKGFRLSPMYGLRKN